jgi:hypothetical protein
VDRQEPPPLDAELLEGLGDETAAAILRGSARLPERERGNHLRDSAGVQGNNLGTGRGDAGVAPEMATWQMYSA